MRIDHLFDLETMAELAGLYRPQGEDFMRALLELFAADAHRTLVRMRVCAWMGDCAELMREAHRLKGSSGSFGAKGLEAECIALEECARGSAPECAELEERVERALSVLKVTREGIRSPALFQKARACSTMQAAT